MVDDFLAMTPKLLPVILKIDKLDVREFKTLNFLIDALKKIKVIDWKKIFHTMYLTNNLYLGYIKNSQNLIRK